jgi:hypothetical protein
MAVLMKKLGRDEQWRRHEGGPRRCKFSVRSVRQRRARGEEVEEEEGVG